MSKGFDITLTGLGFGDEGKGHIVNFLCHKYKNQNPMVLRTSGAHQANHNVVLNDGRHHGFSQFGSGTFKNCETLYLCKVCDPIAALNEAISLQNNGVENPEKLLFFAAESLISTPYHQVLNQLEEQINKSHTSCGVGVWHTLDYFNKNIYLTLLHLKENRFGLLENIRKNILNKIEALIKKYNIYPKHMDIFDEDFHKFIKQKYQEFTDKFQIKNKDVLLLKAENRISIFEGAQGLLLDSNLENEKFATSLPVLGFNKYLNNSKKRTVKHYLITRTYLTRHGDGYFSENNSFSSFDEFKIHNKTNENQGKMRYSILNSELYLKSLNYFKSIINSTNIKLFVTCVDQHNDGNYIGKNNEILNSKNLSADIAK